MNYLEQVVKLLQGDLPDCPVELLRIYAVLALAIGERTTNEHVHAAWSAWKTATRPDHPSLIPYGQLSVDKRVVDTSYRNAIRRVSRQLVRL